MINYAIGFISGICFIKVISIIRLHNYRKHVKVCDSQEELVKAIEDIVKNIEREIRENENKASKD